MNTFRKKNEKGKDDNIKEDDNIDEVDAINEGNYIELNYNMGFIRRRRKAAIIRYFRNNKEDQEQNIKTTMLLFHPFRNEQTEVHRNSNIVEKYEYKKSLVDNEREEFEPNPNFMDELNNIIIDTMQVDEDEEEMEKEEETVTNKEFQNMLKKIHIMVTKVIECKTG